jgi:hypothetical protein
VAFNDEGYSYKATVMKFNGTNWINVGAGGFSTGIANYESLAFSPSGIPYVAYEDCANGYGVTVMKYDTVSFGISELYHSKILIYPNPATDKIVIETLGLSKENILAIVNIEGQDVLTRQITEPKTVVDISSLPSGVYFMRVTGERTIEVGKFIKQ